MQAAFAVTELKGVIAAAATELWLIILFPQATQSK
jgi:hypothetical protein